MKTTENAVENIIATQTLTTPVNRMTLTVENAILATFTGFKPYKVPDREGKPKEMIRFDFMTEEGAVSMTQQHHVVGCREFVLKMFNRALGLKKISELTDNIGKQVSLKTHVDPYDGVIKVQYVNRFNPFADEVVDLSQYDDEAKPEPKKLVFG
jgi:hypothetical protein